MPDPRKSFALEAQEVPVQVAEQVVSKDALIQKASDLKVLPAVAKKAMEVVERENASAEDLSLVIETDKALTTRVLKISNSSLYGLKNEVRDLQHAVALLGLNSVKNLVIAASTKGLHKNFGITEQMMWDHAVGASVGARMLRRGTNRNIEDLAFLGGLLHDVGKVIMNNEVPHAYAEVLTGVCNDGRRSIDLEQEVFGYDHQAIGAGVLLRWGFPTVMVRIVERHHLGPGDLETIENKEQASTIAAVGLADHICRLHGIGFRSPDAELTLSSLPEASYLGLNENELSSIAAEIKDADNAQKALFD